MTFPCPDCKRLQRYPDNVTPDTMVQVRTTIIRQHKRFGNCLAQTVRDEFIAAKQPKKISWTLWAIIAIMVIVIGAKCDQMAMDNDPPFPADMRGF